MSGRSLPLPLQGNRLANVADPEATPTIRSTLAALSSAYARQEDASVAADRRQDVTAPPNSAGQNNSRKGKHRQIQDESTSLVSDLRLRLCEHARRGNLSGVIDILQPDSNAPSGSCASDDYPSAFALVNSHTASGSTPLLEAAGAGQLQVVQYLIAEEGAIRDLEDYDGESAFLRASWAGHLDVMQYLVHGNTSDAMSLTLEYQYSADSEKPAAAPRGTDINSTDRQGWTAMHNAASKGHLAVVMWLCGLQGVDVNAVNEQGYTPLMNAASKGHMPVARFLLSRAGADPFLINRYEESALDIAIACRELGIADYIAQFEESMWPSIADHSKEHDDKAESAESSTLKLQGRHKHSADRLRVYQPLKLHKAWHVVIFEQERMSGKWLAAQRQATTASAVNGGSMFSKSGMSKRHGHSAWELPPSYKGINDSGEWLAANGRTLQPPTSSDGSLTLETDSLSLIATSSTNTGARRSKAASSRDEGWTWRSGWFVDLSLHNVEEATGWQYATSFDAAESEWTAHIPDELASLLLAGPASSHPRRNTTFVRRRRWARIMSRPSAPVPTDGTDSNEGGARPIKLLKPGLQDPTTSLVDDASDYLTRAKYFAGLRIPRHVAQRRLSPDCEKTPLDEVQSATCDSQDGEHHIFPEPSTIDARSAARLRPKLELALAELTNGASLDNHEGRATEAEELRLRLQRLLQDLPRSDSTHAGIDDVWNDDDAASSSDSASISTSARSTSIYSPIYSPRSASPTRSTCKSSANGVRSLAAPFDNLSLAVPTSPGMHRSSSLSRDPRAGPGRVWQPDHEVRACPTCSRAFKLWFRKHHCRLCGEIRCDDCSSNQDYLSAEQVVLGPDAVNAWEGIAFANGGGIYRTCNACHSVLQRAALVVDPAMLLPGTNGLSPRSSELSRASSRSTQAEQDPRDATAMSASGGLQRSMSSLSEVSAMADCPVCGADLQQLESKTAQESHIQTCLESGATARRQENRYLVFELPRLSPLVGSDCLICFETYAAGDRIGRLTCLCTFHRDCIAGWLSRDVTKLPPIILGGGVFGGQYNDERYLRSELPAEVISLAFSHGITAIDTSPFYGASETIIGREISSETFKAKFPRSSYQLLTKAGRYGASRKYFDYSPDRIRRSVLESLDRFHTDYLDVVYLHDCEFVADESPDANGPGFPVDALHAEKQQNLASDADDKAGPGDAAVVEAYKALLQLKAEGKIRQAGLAGYPLPVLLRLARLIRSTLEPVDIVQTYSHYNLQNRTLQAYAPAFYEAGVQQITNASPFNMGLLTANGPPYWHPAPPALRDACKEAHEWLASGSGNLPASSLQSEALRYGVGSALPAAAGGLGITAVIGCTLPEHVEELVKIWRSLQGDQLRDDEDCRKRQDHTTALIESAGYLDWSWQSPPAHEEAERNA